MEDRFTRTKLLYGQEAMERFAKSRVAVFGVGGVGGYVVEALARTGIGALDLIDADRVSLSNINRQIIATTETVGRYKVDVAEERVHAIWPGCRVTAWKLFFLPETQDQIDFSQYDYVVDAIDTVAGKLAIIECAKRAGVPVISAMGAGNKLNPAGFKAADIYETVECPLAKVMRRECRKRGIESLKVVYSPEKPVRPGGAEDESGMAGGGASGAGLQGEEAAADAEQCGRQPDIGRSDIGQSDIRQQSGRRQKSIPGSVAFVPPIVGLIIAGEVINDLAADVRLGQ